MASSPEFAFLLDFGMATIAALGLSYVFSRLRLLARSPRPEPVLRRSREI